MKKITVEDLKKKIVSHNFYKEGTLTICVLTLDNDYKVVGESACLCVENYSEAIGEEVAYENAFDKLWALEGYLIKTENKRNNIS